MTFSLMETTIDDIHESYRDRSLTCRQLVDLYLNRIEGYDKNGPKINSIITINPNIKTEADELDRAYMQSKKLTGPLHGIPIVVKDQIETKDITSTFGSEAFKEYIPDKDATVVARLREAGALILAKTSLPDFATSWFGYSSTVGRTKNPYCLDRDPGGSSGGTGAAVAANFAAVGIGGDTGGSIRLPASFTNVFGLRVTTGLTSRYKTSPLVHFQDTIGPMTRSVKDAAHILDAMVGYDSNDPYTVSSLHASEAGYYAEILSDTSLEGARLGVLREVFGSNDNPEAAPVNDRLERTIQEFKEAGAEIIDPIMIPNLSDYIEQTSMYLIQSKYDINKFIKERLNTSIDDIFEKNQFHPALDLFKDIAAGPDNPEEEPNYFKQLISQERFKREILNVMAKEQLDAIVFPVTQILTPTEKEILDGKWTVLTFPTNTLIASQTGLPSISIPGGFTKDDIPVGVELLGKTFDEAKLLNLAYSYEKHAQPRRVPQQTLGIDKK